MKKIITLITLLVITTALTASAQNCCVKKGQDMRALALNPAFKASHLPPLPFKFDSDKGSMISFECLDSKKGNAYYVPSDEPTTKVLVIFHEWWGLNDYIKREAVRWQALLGNVDVYAVDLYDGQVTDDPDVAAKLAGGLDPKRGDAIVKGVLSKVGKDKLVGTVGWCFGGSWSFTAAMFATNQASGCVMYYGVPEKDPKRVAKLKTDVLFIWGSQDKFIKKYDIDELGKQVKATGHTFDLHVYDGAVHAFANPSNPNYNSLYATQAQNIAVKFLKEKLALD
ncbi:MAG: dienelactone hydrolase family protein [Taibaiella sp.]|nr:dienelactone hydrolase family protein [Taibaiella sp.]